MSQDQRPLKGGISDDLEGGTTGASSMTDGDQRQPNSGQPTGDNPERLGGRTGSPAGDSFMLNQGEGQGDDLADRLGGGEGRGTGMSGGGAATGAMDDDRSEPDAPVESLAPSAGDPGGMGGVRAQGGTGTGRPPGGTSPVQADTDRH